MIGRSNKSYTHLLLIGGVFALSTAAGCGGGDEKTTNKDATTTKQDTAIGNSDLPTATPDIGRDTPILNDTSAGGSGGSDAPLDRGGSGGIGGIDSSVGDAKPDSGAGGSIVEVGRADASDLPMVPDTNTAIDGTPGIDGSGGIDGGVYQCPSAAHAWLYSTPGLTSITWGTDGKLVTGNSFYPTTKEFGGANVTNNGSADMLVAKLDPNTGKAIWAFTAGDNKDQWVTGVTNANGGLAVIGTFLGTLDIDPINQFIPPIVNTGSNEIDYISAITDTDGKGMWSKKVSLGGGKLTAIAGNPNKGYFVVCGAAMNNAANLSAVGTLGGGRDVVVAAVNIADGTIKWAKLFGGANDQQCTAAAMDDAGDVVLAGTFTGTLDFGLGALSPAPTSAQDTIMWVAKLNGVDGAAVASKAFGSSGQVTPKGIELDGQGNTIVVGTFSTQVVWGSQTLNPIGKTDSFVFKFDSTLAPSWARRWGGVDGSASTMSAALNSTGKVTVVGSFTQTVDVGPGSNVLKTSNATGALETLVVTLDGSNGQTLCARNYGDAASPGSGANGIAINRKAAGMGKDQIAIVGIFQKIIDFGGQTTALSIGLSGGFLLEM
jgi:hypothetical protein